MLTASTAPGTGSLVACRSPWRPIQPPRSRRAVDDTKLFFVEDYMLRRVAAAGGNPSDAASFGISRFLDVADMEIDDTAVWIVAGGLYRYAR